MSFGRMGARGVVNQDITPDFIRRISKATAEYLDTHEVAVGRDTRLTGEMFEKAATLGLIHAGVTVFQLGVAPTPSVQYYADKNSIPALQITASHNPPEYNGIKIIGDDGKVLNRTAVESIEEMTTSGELWEADWDSIGDVRQYTEANTDYVESIVNEINRGVISAEEPLVVLDPGHGAGAETSPELFRRLGCQIKTIHAQQDGYFPGRDPEPKRETLDDLTNTVPAVDADLGIAHDGDADRTLVVDETGNLVNGNTLLAALASEVVSGGDVVVTACNSSRRLIDAVEECGGSVELTPIGNSHILSRIVDLENEGESVPLAGEGNGGVIFPGHRLNRDGGYVAAKFLEILGQRRVSEFVNPFRGYHFEKLSIPYESSEEKEKILSRARKWTRQTNGAVSNLDGTRIDLDDQWVLVRPSGTEPYVRIYAEAKSANDAERILQEVKMTILNE